MSEKKKETIVREATGPGPYYWSGSEPTLLDKATDKIKDVAGTAYDTMVKTFGSKGALRKSTVEDMKNAPQAKKKGGVIRSSASKRADGCAIKGKTKGRFV